MDRLSQVNEVPYCVRPEALTQFLCELRLGGYNFGIQEFIVIQNVIIALLEGGERFEDPLRLGNVIAAVLCKTPAEQSEFHGRFAHWIASSAANRKDKAPVRLSSIDPFRKELLEVEVKGRRWKRAAYALLAVAAAFAAYELVKR
jgi:hypothetical protein